MPAAKGLCHNKSSNINGRFALKMVILHKTYNTAGYIITSDCIIKEGVKAVWEIPSLSMYFIPLLFSALLLRNIGDFFEYPMQNFIAI